MTTASSDLTLLGLVRHLAGVEQYWLGSVFLGLNETLPWDDPNDRDSDFHPQENDTLADVLVLLRAEIDRARQLASTTPLEPCRSVDARTAVGQLGGGPGCISSSLSTPVEDRPWGTHESR